MNAIIQSSSFPELHLPINPSNFQDPDDLIKDIEAKLFTSVKKPMHYLIDFTISNFPKLCDAILSPSNS